MRGAVVRGYSVKEFCKKTLPNVGLVNLIVFCKIESDEESIVVQLSEMDHCVVVAATKDGCVVADCGEIIARLHPSFTLGEGSLGCPEPVNTSFGRIGILVGDDVYYPEAARLLAIDGAKLLIVLPTSTNTRTVALSRAHAIANGVRLLFCGADYGFAADFTGKTSTFDGNVVSVECALTTKQAMLNGL